MIDYQRSANGIYEVSVSGRLTKAEIDIVWAKITADMPASEKVKVLEVIHDFDGIDFDAILEDLRVGLPMAGRVSHIAIVTDRKWITALTRLAGVLMSAEMRTYTLDQLAEARAWLDAALTDAFHGFQGFNEHGEPFVNLFFLRSFIGDGFGRDDERAGMIVSHFLKWVYTARVAQRAAAASALARAYVDADLPFEDRCAAEAALTFLLDDPSAKVRLAMAEALSMSRHAPIQIISALAADQPEVAGMVLGRSPLLTDADLIDRVASGTRATQLLIADRPFVSMALCAAIAEIGEADACAVLLANHGAEIASLSFRRMAERHGHVPAVREALIADPRLPADCRHMLLVKLGEALKGSPLVLALMGQARAERLMRDACIKASVTLIEGTRGEEHAALVEHLRLRGDLTASFIVRTLAHGKVDFFGSVLVALTGQAEQRVRALLAGGHDTALQALFGKAGLSKATHAVLIRALKIWRDVANGKRVAGVQEVSWLMLKELGGQAAEGELASLVKSIHLDALRENARGHALAIAAA